MRWVIVVAVLVILDGLDGPDRSSETSNFSVAQLVMLRYALESVGTVFLSAWNCQ